VPNIPEQDTPAEPSAGHQAANESSRLQKLRVRRDSPAAGRDAFVMLVSQLQQRLVVELGHELNLSDPSQARSMIQEKLEAVLAEEKLTLNRNEKRQVIEAILRDLTSTSGATKP
jgi:hypothetical protein